MVRQRTAEWLAMRLARVTASEAAAVLGENPYESATDVLFKKHGLGKPFVGNAATRYGQHYEPEAIAAYCAATGRVSFEVGLIDHRAMHAGDDGDASLSFLAGSPDGVTVLRRPDVDKNDTLVDTTRDAPRAMGLVGAHGAEPPPVVCERALQRLVAPGEEDPVLLEVKCPYRRRIEPGTIPRHYYAQVQLNMLICRLRCADFVEYRPQPFELSIVRVYRDEPWLRCALPVLRAFHEECARYAGCIETHPAYARYARAAHYARRAPSLPPSLSPAACPFASAAADEDSTDSGEGARELAAERGARCGGGVGQLVVGLGVGEGDQVRVVGEGACAGGGGGAA
jgi:putative phage-type endonuclease